MGSSCNIVEVQEVKEVSVNRNFYNVDLYSKRDLSEATWTAKFVVSIFTSKYFLQKIQRLSNNFLLYDK